MLRLKIIPKSEFVISPKSEFVINPKSEFVINPNTTVAKQKRFKYTLETFLERAHNIHGDKFDYSSVTSEHIVNGRESMVPLICKTCGYHWETRVHNHIIGKSGCHNCAGNLPWTYDRFITRAKEIHEDKYNYDKIGPSDVVNKSYMITIICNNCDHVWMTTIHHHINMKQGCPKCAGCLRWELKYFVERARLIHGDKYDYSKIITSDVVNRSSSVKLKCNKCQHDWITTIASHINSKRGCTRCADNYPWTFDEFVEEANILHNNKYIYERPIGIVNAYTRINLKCADCECEWETNINTHINCKHGCANCAGTAP